jgi:MFS transporter, FHS family, glucose/mannose:H+ symporter
MSAESAARAHQAELILMQSRPESSVGRTLAVLHPAFALTGVLQAIGGPLLPSIAAKFHLSDSQSGLLFFLYFAGTALGVFFCRENYARAITLGYVAMAACCIGVAVATRPLLPPVFLLLGISVGIPMSGVSLYVGRAFVEKRAPMLTFLNFSWSAGALVAPLLAAPILVHHTYRFAYVLLAFVAGAAAICCALFVRDAYEAPRKVTQTQRLASVRLILVFALAAFLQVGIENTAATWLSTYSLRATGASVVLAAASTSLYWGGFLASRGLSSLLLLRTAPVYVFRAAVAVALAAAVLLAAASSPAIRSLAMLLLGIALAPIYPLVIAGFFARAHHTSQSRWVLATAGFGGSVLPWLAGWISTHTGSLRMGILTIPVALAIMVLVLPSISASPTAASEN